MPTVDGGSPSKPSVVKRLLDDRSVAFWQVASGACAVITLIAACSTWGWTRLRSPEDQVKDNPTAESAPAMTSPPSPKPPTTQAEPSTQSSFVARETKYLTTLEPVKEYSWWGKWADAPATVNDVAYKRAITTSTCGYDLYREYLVKRQYKYFRADVGIADDTEDAFEAEVHVVDEQGMVLERATIRPGAPASFDVPVDEVLRLKLLVKEGGCWTRTVVWGDARLVR
ncbi:NPCBM/NEW2 domain-containing protein [Micromonospora sp. URMC 107]|uniref:NPCBM/NEW2 domain-containing protein n=1 Tax=Micromonospora sp. URMC 107 TaxID=3423418 RepID=UPI003F1B0706